MLKSKLLPPLVALAALMLVVSGTLAAVVFSGNDDEPEEATLSAVATATPRPGSLSPVATATATAVVTTNEIPEHLRARFDVLPDRLRNETLEAYEAGAINDEILERLIVDYENRNTGVRVGSVLTTTTDSVSIEVYTTGERVDVLVDDDTVIRRAQRDITPVDLQVDELIMVVSMDEGVTAFSIDAFGVEAPEPPPAR